MKQSQRLFGVPREHLLEFDDETERLLLALVEEFGCLSSLSAVVDSALDRSLALMNARHGNVQLLDPTTRSLRIAAHDGFNSEFLDYFAVVDDNASVCGRAMQDCDQIVIHDVQADPGFVPHRHIASSAGFRAVQSTPLVDATGTLVGMLSTHYPRPHRPSDRDLRLMEIYGVLIGTTIRPFLDVM